jgi:tetratricopeptide (TPR) repeat protein
MRHPINPQEFLDVVRPALSQGDAEALAERVAARWTNPQLRSLLFHPDTDVRRVSAVVLGLVGGEDDAPSLARALWDMDEQVNQMAEHGLWSIWFRSGSPSACKPFREGVALLEVEGYEQAAEAFLRAIHADPCFAEAHHQCGIAHFFLGNWKASAQTTSQAIRLNPLHFGAIASMGHCYAELGDLRKAKRCYRLALRINPRMPQISRAIRRLKRAFESQPGGKEDSGEFHLEEIMV